MIRPNRVRAVVAVPFIAAVLLAAGCSGDTEGLFGRDLYEKSCAHCHGEAGEGSSAGTPLGPGSSSVDLSDDQIRGVIRVGPGAMPGYPRFSDEQVDSLVSFMRELQAPGG